MELARALSSHANPKGDLETLFERALDLYVEHLQKKRFGKTDRPRVVPKPTSEDGRKPGPGVPHQVDVRTERNEAAVSKRAHITHETRREVFERDGLRCAFVSAAGRRCNEQAFLQIHHQDPSARTENDRPSNLHIYCAAHNRFEAEQDFGEQHVARKIQEARAQRGPAQDSEPGAPSRGGCG